MQKGCAAIFVGPSETTHNPVSIRDYAEAKHLYELLSEITKVLLRKNGLTAQQAINEFVGQCNKGEYVLLKSYGSFNKSVICRLCFLHNFLKIFETQGIQRNGLDYYQLSRLLCSDFPKEFIQKAVHLIVQADPTTEMYVPLSPKQFAQAFYLHVICGDYLQALLCYFQQQKKRSCIALYRILDQQNKRIVGEFNKPPFACLVQSLLNLMRKRGMLLDKPVEVVFLTQENIQQFISTVGRQDPGVSFQDLIKQLLQSQEYKKLVDQNIEMFQNSSNWATDQHKILSSKEPLETPLNFKKKTSKK